MQVVAVAEGHEVCLDVPLEQIVGRLDNMHRAPFLEGLNLLG